jgi:hypothetical protein
VSYRAQACVAARKKCGERCPLDTRGPIIASYLPAHLLGFGGRNFPLLLSKPLTGRSDGSVKMGLSLGRGKKPDNREV